MARRCAICSPLRLFWIPSLLLLFPAAVAVLLLTLAPRSLSAEGASEMAARPEIIAYVFPNQPEGRLLAPGDVNPTGLTRINYAFALIGGGRVVESTPNDAANLAFLETLKTAQPHLKILVSVGGWLGSGGFSDAALTSDSRRQFIDSAVAFLERYRLDGLDLDWEYPGLAGAGNRFRPEDGANFALLLRELRTRFDAQARLTHKPLLLTIAAGASAAYLAHTPMADLARSLDTVNLMAYDFYEPGDGKPTPTGNHAPLFADPADPGKASAADMVAAFLHAGVPASKLVLGVPFYGHAWAEVPPANHGLFQPGTAAPALRTGYTDVQALLDAGFTRYWDTASQVPFAYNSATRQFISYEDPESLRHKVAFIRERHLAGIMFWQYFSDPSGTLLHAIGDALAAPPPTRSAQETRP